VDESRRDASYNTYTHSFVRMRSIHSSQRERGWHVRLEDFDPLGQEHSSRRLAGTHIRCATDRRCHDCMCKESRRTKVRAKLGRCRCADERVLDIVRMLQQCNADCIDRRRCTTVYQLHARTHKRGLENEIGDWRHSMAQRRTMRRTSDRHLCRAR